MWRAEPIRPILRFMAGMNEIPRRVYVKPNGWDEFADFGSGIPNDMAHAAPALECQSFKRRELNTEHRRW